MPDDRFRCILAAAAVDGAGAQYSPAAICTRGNEIVSIDQTDRPPGGEGFEVVDRRDRLVIPALVNVHCHLDLTDIGPTPRPYGGDFVAWIRWIIKTRSQTDDEGVAVAVRHGAELARRGGTSLVGDIAGASCIAAVQALRASGLAGVSYFEVFGQGTSQSSAIEAMRDAAEADRGLLNGVQLGLSPHTPFSCGMDVYRAAASFNLPLCTHLAETLAELEFVEKATGPFAELLRRVGGWDDSIRPTGRHAADVVLEATGGRPILAAHLNYINYEHLNRLADARVSVAYCPRASAYFYHPADGHPPHRYREMLDIGINVALGTDSIICLDTPDRISVLDEMRYLHRRDATDPVTLLRMATVNGARALGFDDSLVQLSAGPSGGLLALRAIGDTARDLLADALRRDDEPEWVLGPVDSNRLGRFHLGV